MQNAYYFEIYATKREPLNFAAMEGSNAVPMMFRVMDWDIPAGATASIFFEKPSGLLIYNAGTIDGNLMTFPMTTQMTAEVGLVEGQIEVIQSTNVLHTFPFRMRVIKSIIDSSAIESTNEFTALEEALAQVQGTVPMANVAGKGTSSRPVYFDANGVAVPISVLAIENGGTGSSTAAGALTNLGAEPIANVTSKGNSGLPVYFDANGVAQPITKADLQATLDVDDMQTDITNIQTALSNIAGGLKIIVGHDSMAYSTATEMYKTLTTGLSSVTYAFATISHTAAGTNYPTASSNRPTVYVRKNFSNAGQIKVSAFGTGFVSGHSLPFDWMAIGE